MSTPVRTTAIQKYAAEIQGRYSLTDDLRVVCRTNGREVRVRSGAGTGKQVSLVVGSGVAITVSYNRLRWYLGTGALPDTVVKRRFDGALLCGGDVLAVTGQTVTQKPVAKKKTSWADWSDTCLLASFDNLMSEFSTRGIDPIRRVRTVTTEVPL